MICERDLGICKLPTLWLWPFVPDIGEAGLLLEALAFVCAGQADPSAKDHRVAQVAHKWRPNCVGICVAAWVTDQIDQSGFIGDAPVRTRQHVVVRD